jgi:hypothetical protein
MLGHLAWQEQLYWLERAQGLTPVPEPYLDSLDGAALSRRWKRKSSRETPGTKLHRTTYHYWFHLSESQAVRQMLGHTKLHDFVGRFGKNQYRPEAGATAS